MKYTIKEFLDKRFAVNVTEAEWPECAKMLEYAGIIWKDDKKPTQFKPTFPYVFIEEYCGENRLVQDSGSSRDFVPFRTFYADEIWRQFAAGRCYLRVTKDEWPEFAKGCEAAGIKWCAGESVLEREATALDKQGYAYVFIRNGVPLDISGLDAKFSGYGATDKPIHPFSAIARPEAEPPKPEYKVGDLFEVIDAGFSVFSVGEIIKLVRDDGSDFPFFQSVRTGAEHCKCIRKLKPYTPPPDFPRIEITTDGTTTTATLYEGGEAVRTGTATCGLDDKFSFMEGAAIAYNRMKFGKHSPNWTCAAVTRVADEIIAAAQKLKEAQK